MSNLDDFNCPNCNAHNPKIAVVHMDEVNHDILEQFIVDRMIILECGECAYFIYIRRGCLALDGEPNEPEHKSRWTCKIHNLTMPRGECPLCMACGSGQLEAKM